MLILDGSEGQHESLAFATALRPGGQQAEVRTGWRPKVVTAGKIETLGPLDDYAAVLLLDVPRPTANLVQALETYVSQGGGLLLGIGPSVDRSAYNRLLFGERQGALLPVQLDLPTQAPPANENRESDLQVADHPLLRVFAGDRNSFLKLISINYYFGLEKPQADAAPTGLQTIASLQNGAPLMIEYRQGEGRVVGLFHHGFAAARRRGRLEQLGNLTRVSRVGERACRVPGGPAIGGATIRRRPALDRWGDRRRRRRIYISTDRRRPARGSGFQRHRSPFPWSTLVWSTGAGALPIGGRNAWHGATAGGERRARGR